MVEDGKLENGDLAVIDFEGFIDGEPFEGGKAENYNLELGSNTFIPGFEEQLVGMAKGEEKEIKVTFPEEYHVEELKGKEAVFKVKVNEIKRKNSPSWMMNLPKMFLNLKPWKSLKPICAKN